MFLSIYLEAHLHTTTDYWSTLYKKMPFQSFYLPFLFLCTYLWNLAIS